MGHSFTPDYDKIEHLRQVMLTHYEMANEDYQNLQRAAARALDSWDEYEKARKDYENERNWNLCASDPTWLLRDRSAQWNRTESVL